MTGPLLYGSLSQTNFHQLLHHGVDLAVIQAPRHPVSPASHPFNSMIKPFLNVRHLNSLAFLLLTLAAKGVTGSIPKYTHRTSRRNTASAQLQSFSLRHRI